METIERTLEELIVKSLLEGASVKEVLIIRVNPPTDETSIVVLIKELV